MAERDAAPAPARHIPVMLAEVLAALTMPAPKAAAKALEIPPPAAADAVLPLAGQRIVDGTFGNGGYSRAFLAAGAEVLGLDRDPDAVAAARALAAQSGGRFRFRETKFSRLDEAAAEIWGGETAGASEKQEAARGEAPRGNEKTQAGGGLPAAEAARSRRSEASASLAVSEKTQAGEGLPAASAAPPRRPEASALLVVSGKTQAGESLLDAVVLDIGVSSMQIDEAERGFSFQKDGPLDMRMARRGMSAAEAVNRLKPEDLARIFHFYGEERWAGRIARMIAARRESRPFTSTLDLAAAIAAMGLHKREKIHPATRVFQALRIYVNNELGELACALAAAERALRPGGRLIVVSFHSLEDRVVKKFFAARAGGRPGSRHLPDADLAEPSFLPLIKGAQSAGAAELAANPRARSAKLRAGMRTNAAPCRDDESIYGFADLPPLFGE